MTGCERCDAVAIAGSGICIEDDDADGGYRRYCGDCVAEHGAEVLRATEHRTD